MRGLVSNRRGRRVTACLFGGGQGSDKIWTWDELTGSELREHPHKD